MSPGADQHCAYAEDHRCESTQYRQSDIKCELHNVFVKLRRGSGKDRQGMAVKAKGLKA